MIVCFLVCITFVGCFDQTSTQGADDLLASDYRLFHNTPVWNLAVAIRDENIDEIKRIVREEKPDINVQESKFGQTLLILTVLNEQYSSCEALLQLGADLNKHNHYNGSSAIIEAAGINGTDDDNTKFLRLLLKHGANPNDEEIGDRRQGNMKRNTPLLKACSNVNKLKSPVGKVKLLVEAGANIDYKNEFNQTPLSEAFVLDHYDVVIYLLEKGVDYRRVISTDVEGKEYYLWDKLRYKLLPLDTEEYKQKMAIVEFLKAKGIDYKRLPIPEYALEEAKKRYPKNWKGYLEKY